LEHFACFLWVALLGFRVNEWPGIAAIIDHDGLSGPLGIKTDLELLAQRRISEVKFPLLLKQPCINN
jgi:hypothetical protein